MSVKSTIYVVDDDAGVRDALSLLLTLHGYAVRSFASGQLFLESMTASSQGIIILDLRLGDSDGLAILSQLQQTAAQLPVIMLTAYGDVATARNALRGGAADFLEKPVDEEQLIHRIQELELEQGQNSRREPRRRHDELRGIRERLTPRELDILNHLLEGGTAREIAATLGISARTVEAHRAHIMEKFGVSRIPDLLRLLLQPGSGNSG
ncbi:response regulator transcription factor [Permianibacter sp. IMCC34836]|uniref:response regulator transcription factor n=1 Tax=Permianibacter fluminis TaxID=2738515 RepID=UPI0015547598|nr:response regulator [Permianibacter fluminis]NQD38746.1 response regulator transcription factor [Permianibacter fluminis]